MSVNTIVFAQNEHNLEYHLETVALTGSGEYAPFWHTSNRQGLPSVNKNSGYMHFATLGSTSLGSGIVMDYGMD